ncbi:MAG: hypothetical protein Q9169_008327 [Polycauliona sp. 2 TL-2023]
MLGTDDLLACFVAGNTLNWDDGYRTETETDSFQETLDMFINIGIFIWFGAVCPRLPAIWMMSKKIKQCHNLTHTLFMGYFGPIGVGAAFYLHVAMEFLHLVQVDGHVREDAEDLKEVLHIVVWFIIMSSILIHGLSVPTGKLAFSISRNVERAIDAHSSSSGKSYHQRGEAKRRSLRASMAVGHGETSTQMPRRKSLMPTTSRSVDSGVLPLSPREVHFKGQMMPDAALESGESEFSLLQKYPGPK